MVLDTAESAPGGGPDADEFVLVEKPEGAGSLEGPMMAGEFGGGLDYAGPGGAGPGGAGHPGAAAAAHSEAMRLIVSRLEALGAWAWGRGRKRGEGWVGCGGVGCWMEAAERAAGVTVWLYIRRNLDRCCYLIAVAAVSLLGSSGYNKAAELAMIFSAHIGICAVSPCWAP